MFGLKQKCKKENKKAVPWHYNPISIKLTASLNDDVLGLG
jgi:hypothetical protein